MSPFWWGIVVGAVIGFFAGIFLITFLIIRVVRITMVEICREVTVETWSSIINSFAFLKINRKREAP